MSPLPQHYTEPIRIFWRPAYLSGHARPYAAGLDCQVVARHQNLEVIMTLSKISLASAAAITIISWGALAQENQDKGRITQLDHTMARLLFNMRQSELLVKSVHLPLSTSTKYKTASRPKTCTPATKWTSPQPRLAAS